MALVYFQRFLLLYHWCSAAVQEFSTNLWFRTAFGHLKKMSLSQDSPIILNYEKQDGYITGMLTHVVSLEVKASIRDILRSLKATIMALGQCFTVPLPCKTCIFLLSIEDGLNPWKCGSWIKHMNCLSLNFTLKFISSTIRLAWATSHLLRLIW